jgi:hypothetical protein
MAGEQSTVLLYPRDNRAWMLEWKMRDIFLNMLKTKLPFSEQDVITLLNWSVRGNETHTYSAAFLR